MMESEVTGNCHASFGERDGETRRLKDLKMRSVPTLFSPLIANLVLNGLENVGHKVRYTCRKDGSRIDTIHGIRYADDVVFILKLQDDPEQLRQEIDAFLAIRGLKVNEAKTKVVPSTDGFNFLGFNFKVKPKGKFI